MKLRRTKKLLRFLFANKQSRFLDLVAIAGFAALVYGSWQAYPPAGPVVGGVLALAFALMARTGPKDGDE